MEIKAEM